MQLNRPLGHALKEQGMQRALVSSGSWSERVLDEFRAWIDEQRELGFKTVTIEAFRAQAKNQPNSHQAWGSMPSIAQAAGLIEPEWAAPGIQARVKAAAPKTHCHEVRVWRLVESMVSA